MTGKALAVILIGAVVLSLTACGGAKTTPISVNVEGKSDLSNGVFGRSAMVEIGDGLWYDATTRIVYWWNGVFRSDYAITPSPYYAPNGLPYRYDPEKNMFKEIG